ncbi:hypothetical protein [Acidisoma cladoniae]|uniref:hypothetical protein n=1 Tax=Acidisoma cladoniae TaxID=3040935 RepID=UPI00254AED96|nr:hypothetical protein [Acidisoma sp. PAMC 29798]
MNRQLWLVTAVVLGTAAFQAHAADRTVRLEAAADLRSGIAAMPLIAEPANNAERKINEALHRLDATVLKAAAACKASDSEHNSWDRSVDVAMQGPRFLSYAISDNEFCGGAHDDSSTMAIVYDLKTGSPVDWSTLLPPSLTGKLSLDMGADGTKMVTLSGRTLYALYLTAYRPRTGDPKKDAYDDDCRDTVAEAGVDGAPPGMMAWLDAKTAGLVVEFDLPHVSRACGDSVTIPAAALRVEGSNATLVDALLAAYGHLVPPP